jgi:hypothetical protein
MAHLVGHHPLQLIAVEGREEALRDGHDARFGRHTRGEGIRVGVGDHDHARHRQTGGDPHLVDDVDQLLVRAIRRVGIHGRRRAQDRRRAPPGAPEGHRESHPNPGQRAKRQETALVHRPEEERIDAEPQEGRERGEADHDDDGQAAVVDLLLKEIHE